MTLVLTRLELREVEIPFRFSFKHNLAARTAARSLILRLYTGTGHVGYGEAIPRDYLTGETLESAWKDIAERWWPAVKALNLTPGESPLRTLRGVYEEADRERRTAGYAGLDIAVVDAWSRATDTPLPRILGAMPEPVALSAAIGGGSVRSARRQARFFRFLGFEEFKLKVGRDDDRARAAAVRGVIGPDRDLRLDANAAWDEKTALARMDEFANLDISSLEQPLPPGDVQALARVQAESGVPVMADESLCTRADALRLARAEAAQLWNVRLAKVGGFSGALSLFRLAGECGIGVHLGVLVGETSILAAAGRALAGIAPFAHVEYGFPRLLLRRDPVRGDPGGLFGTGRPLGAAAGLGVHARERLLETFTRRRIELD